MKRENAILSSRGQLTLPSSVRKSVDIKQGDVLNVYEVDERFIIIEKAQTTLVEDILARFAGSAGKKKIKAEDLADELRSIRKSVYRETYGSRS